MAKEAEEKVLTPVEIEHQTFEPQNFGGYNTHQVDQFLRKVVVSFEKILQENATLRERIDFLGEQIYRYQKIENSIREAYLAAQNASQSFIQLKKKDAEQLVDDARKEADRIRNETLNEKEKIEKEIMELMGNKEALQKEEFRILVRACLEVLEERKGNGV